MPHPPAIQINPLLPTWLSNPISNAVENIILNTCRDISKRSLKETVDALEAQAYFAACKQLLFLMDPYDREVLGPMQSIGSLPIMVPGNLAVSLASAISIDTRAGSVRIKYITLLFRRWLVQGLSKFPHSAYKSDTAQLIWKDRESKTWLDDTLKPFCLAENMFGEECRRLRQCIDAPNRDPVYDVLGIRMASKEHELGVMFEMFNHCCDVYNDTYGVIIGAVLVCVDAHQLVYLGR